MAWDFCYTLSLHTYGHRPTNNSEWSDAKFPALRFLIFHQSELQVWKSSASDHWTEQSEECSGVIWASGFPSLRAHGWAPHVACWGLNASPQVEWGEHANTWGWQGGEDRLLHLPHGCIPRAPGARVWGETFCACFWGKSRWGLRYSPQQAVGFSSKIPCRPACGRRDCKRGRLTQALVLIMHWVLMVHWSRDRIYVWLTVELQDMKCAILLVRASSPHHLFECLVSECVKHIRVYTVCSTSCNDSPGQSRDFGIQ